MRGPIEKMRSNPIAACMYSCTTVCPRTVSQGRNWRAWTVTLAPVEDEEVGAILLFDNSPKRTLQLGVEVTEGVHVRVTALLQQRDALGEGEPQWLEGGHLKGVLLRYDLQLIGCRMPGGGVVELSAQGLVGDTRDGGGQATKEQARYLVQRFSSWEPGHGWLHFAVRAHRARVQGGPCSPAAPVVHRAAGASRVPTILAPPPR